MFDTELLVRYPEQSGVYLMKDDAGIVIYVGKAKNLRARIRQYFGQDERIQIPQLIAHLETIETIITPSEKEALLLEGKLIKRFRPKYNILLKDDKSHLLLRIDMQHPWPKIELVREKEDLSPKLFGPYSCSRDAKQLFDLVVRLFQLRQCSDEVFCRRLCPCLLHQLRRCTAPCVGKVRADEYQIQVSEATEFLEGNVAEVRKKLFADMHEASDRLEFERAGEFLRRIKLLDTVSANFLKKQRSTAKRVDAFGIWFEGNYLALSIMHYRGDSLEYGEAFLFDKSVVATDRIEALEQLCIQYYMHSLEESPSLILFPQGEWNIPPLEEVLDELCRKKVHVQQPSVGVKRAMVDLSCENARARIAQSVEGKERREGVLESLEEKLFLKRFPHTIDCFDASHLSGKDLVASCVRYIQGEPSKADYRSFIIKEVSTGDDTGMLHEAVRRRYKRSEECDEALPDVILVDGGKNQVKAVLLALHENSLWDIDVVGIVKEGARHDKGLSAETLVRPDRAERISLPITSQELHFLQMIRDEAHRYVIGFQKKRRKKTMFASELDSIPGIGEKKKKKLLKAFASVDAIRKASVQEIVTIGKISLRDATQVLEKLLSEPS